MALNYIQTDSRRLTFAECWHLSPGWLAFVVLAFCKTFRIRLKLGPAVPMPDLAREFQAQPEDVPPHIHQAIEPLLREMQALGFHSPQFSFVKEQLVRHLQVCTVSLLHSSGEILGHIAYSKANLLHPPMVKIFGGFQSVRQDGTSISTSAGPRQMDPLPGDNTIYRTGKPLAEVYALHMRRVEREGARNLRSFRTPADVWDCADAVHIRLIRDRMGRRVWQPGAPEPAPPPIPGPPPLPGAVANPDNAVFEELQKLQQPKKSWAAGFLFFAATLVLFVAAGSWQWNWRYALMLVPILLFHEYGHYLAMRLFKYQHLKMFFVPFFGAAVSGLRLSAPAWQQAVVALAGPVPGILVGGFILWWARRLDVEWLERFGFLTVVVNGFNLLPILPLDGGRVLDALLYVRSRWLEAAAVVLGCLGFLTMTLLGMSKIFLFLGLLMLVALPHLWKVGKIAGNLRRKGFQTDPPEASSISIQAASSILSETRAHLSSRPMPARSVAQTVLSVYQRLHTRFAGWAATTGLLTAHFASFVLSIVFLFGPLVGIWDRHDWLTDFNKPAETPLLYQAGSPIQRAGPLEHLTNQVAVAGVFPDPELARAGFDSLLQLTNLHCRAAQLGPALLVSAPASLNPEQWMQMRDTAFSAATNKPLAALTNAQLFLHIRAEFEQLAQAEVVEGQIKEYLGVPPGFKISPPWSSVSFSPEEKERRSRALVTYRELVSTFSKAAGHPEVTELHKQILAATKTRRSTEELVAKLQPLIRRHAQALQRELLARSDYDASVVQVYLRQPAFEHLGEMTAWHLDMGAAIDQGGASRRTADGEFGLTGVLDRTEREVSLLYVQFDDLCTGLPALFDYLCQAGCSQVRFGIENTAAEDLLP